MPKDETLKKNII